MDSVYLKKQLIGEIEEAMRVKELSVQLMEQLAYTGHWILNYCDNNNIRPPNTGRLLELIEASKTIVKDIYEPYRQSDESLQSGNNDENRRRLDKAVICYCELSQLGKNSRIQKSHIYYFQIF